MNTSHVLLTCTGQYETSVFLKFPLCGKLCVFPCFRRVTGANSQLGTLPLIDYPKYPFKSHI